MYNEDRLKEINNYKMQRTKQIKISKRLEWHVGNATTCNVSSPYEHLFPTLAAPLPAQLPAEAPGKSSGKIAKNLGFQTQVGDRGVPTSSWFGHGTALAISQLGE